MDKISAAAKVIIVDPDPKYGNLLSHILKGDGYLPLVVSKGEKVIELIGDDPPIMILTEIHLGGEMDGLGLIRRVHEFSEIPMIVVTAQDEVQNELEAFEVGADDFIPKPFDARVLLARVRARLKKVSGEPPYPATLQLQHITIHLAARQVFSEDKPVYLTETEYNLLLELARNANHLLPHEHLLTSVWGKAYKNEVNYLRSYVHTLRRKLEKDPANPQLILSRPGVGYMLVSNPPIEGGNG